MKFFANVIPAQKSTIPWGWKNKKTSSGIFATSNPGIIRMPELCKFFDWHQYVVEDMSSGLAFGTRNMKSVFITASRFMGWESLLIEEPDLSPITRGFLDWNSRLAASWDGKLKYFMIGDDIAWNHGLLINPDRLRSWIIPEHKKLIEAAIAWGMTVIFHSDGDLWDVLDDYEDLGVRILYYQNVGNMRGLKERPEMIFNGFKGHMWHNMLCVESDDSDRPNTNTMQLQEGVAK